jgi:PAS domain S-box-containing protein
MNGLTQISGTYDDRLVALSILIAIFAAYAALDLAGRVTASRGTARLAWLLGGAFALGSGIWAMHYTGMLAFRLPIRVYYNIPTVVLSFLAAVGASWIALYITSRERITPLSVAAGSLLMGAGIATMHYTGMAAMRMDAMPHYRLGLWVLSVVLAVVISLIAQLLISYSRNENRNWLLKCAVAVLLGLAIPVTHYVGMAAVSFTSGDLTPDLSWSVDISAVASAAILMAVFVVLAFVAMTSIVDRRLSLQQLTEVQQSQQLAEELVKTNSLLRIQIASREFADEELRKAHLRLQVLTESSIIGVISGFMNGQIHEGNQAFLDMTGYTREDLNAGKVRWDQMITAKSGAAVDDVLRQLNTSGVATPVPLEHTRKDGSLLVALTGLRALNDPVTDCIGFMIDITDQQRAEEALRASEQRLRLVLDSAPDAIYGVDLHGDCTFCNPACVRVLGYDDPRDLLGKNVHGLIHHTRADGTPYPVEQCRIYETFERGGDVHADDEVLWRKDGTSFAAEYWSRPMTHEGRTVGSVVAFLDITARKEVEEALKSALRMRSDFVSFATHQLRTPLAGIKWLLELAGQSELSEDSASLIQDAREAAERLIRLVNTLLDASRLEGGKLVIEPQSIDLGELTQSVLSDVNHQIQAQKHELSIRGGDQIPHVEVDPQLFRQVILNLISNAVKYTPSGGRIAVEMSRNNGSVQWSIQDNGIGIPKAGQARLFEKFFRADNVHRMETEGTGLGLYIVRLIVERSGGKIWCESEEGQGTTFKFELAAKEST